MSTRACYIVEDPHRCLVVYKHHDGYPEGGVSFIMEARKFAWKLPRFEACDWAAAFARANKDDGGGVRFFGGGHTPYDWRTCNLLPGDIEYLYHIKCPERANGFRPTEAEMPVVTVYMTMGGYNDKPMTFHEIGNFKLNENVTKKMIEDMDRHANTLSDATDY